MTACRKQTRACPVHEYQRHGREAEELRAGVEELIAGGGDCCCNGCWGGDLAEKLQSLLDRVDARDSLAYRERTDPKDVISVRWVVRDGEGFARVTCTRRSDAVKTLRAYRGRPREPGPFRLIKVTRRRLVRS